MGISNICAVTGYGDHANRITAALKVFSCANLDTTNPQDQPAQDSAFAARSLSPACRLFTRTHALACDHSANPATLPFLHVILVFVHHLMFCPDALAYLAPYFPWKATAELLNSLLNGSPFFQDGWGCDSLTSILESEQFPGVVEEKGKEAEGAAGRPGRWRRPLPEDFTLRGFPWAQTYFPDGWFAPERVDDHDEEKYFERPGIAEERRQRVVWLGCRIAEGGGGRWLRLDMEAKRFVVGPGYEDEVDLEKPVQVLSTGTGESVDAGELPDVGIRARRAGVEETAVLGKRKRANDERGS